MELWRRLIRRAEPTDSELWEAVRDGQRRRGIIDIGHLQAVNGQVHGQHYTSFVPVVRDHRRAGRDDEAEALLLDLIDAVEREAIAIDSASAAAGGRQTWGIAPWYYEQIAIIRRKRGDHIGEVRILLRHRAASGNGVQLSRRLERAMRNAGL